MIPSRYRGIEKTQKEINEVLDKIRDEITSYKDDKVIHEERNEMIDIFLEIIDRYVKGGE